MRACVENLAGRLSAAEAELVCTARRASAMQILSTQLVPRAELQILQVKLKSCEEQAAEAAEAARIAALEQQRVIERLGQLLTTQQEECVELRARLQVPVDQNVCILFIKPYVCKCVMRCANLIARVQYIFGCVSCRACRACQHKVQAIHTHEG
jgi:hypothetical protein